MACLKIENLRVRFRTPSGEITAVDNVSIEHRQSECLALVGESGCGKSTLAHSILRLLPENTETRGKILFEGRDLLLLAEKEMANIRANKISIIPQNPALSLNPVYSISHQVAEIYCYHKRLSKAVAEKRSQRLLEKLGFENPREFLGSYPHQFSEGMNQRVLIASAFALSPKMIIADEPTKGLDERLKKTVIKEMAVIQKKAGILLITHDLKTALHFSDRIAIMYCGEIVELASTEEFCKQPFHPYSRGLVGSLPENGFKPIPGESPSMISPPTGCRFHPRCPEKKKRCLSQKPDLKNVSGRSIRCFLYL